MLILHVITNLTSGGAELMLKRLTAAQAEDPRFEHRVISLVDLATVGPQLEAHGVPVTALGMRSPLDLPRIFARLVKEMRRRRPDVVQTWMYHADLIGGLAARAAGVRQVIWGVRIADIGPHMGIPRATQWIRAACARLSRTVPAVIVYVAHSARTVHERLGYDPAKSVVIPNGYEIPASCDRARLRTELGVPTEFLIFGSAGRFSGQKDPRTFVEAAGALARVRPDLCFVMVGRGYTPENRQLGRWIEESGAAEQFRLLGERSDLRELLAGMDAFCLHSIGEGFPNVVAEAMSVGVPCVVTDVGDAAFLVAGTGLVVPPGQPAALARALEKVAQMPVDERQELGRAAKQRIVSEFSMERISRRYAELYEQLAAVPSTGNSGVEVQARNGV